MNGNPNAAQKRFHVELREMNRFSGLSELHHVFGSKRKIYKYEKAGEWLVLFILKSDHENIKQLGFEWEQDQMVMQKKSYEKYFNKPHPMPDGLLTSFINMRNSQQVMKGYSPWGDDD